MARIIGSRRLSDEDMYYLACSRLECMYRLTDGKLSPTSGNSDILYATMKLRQQSGPGQVLMPPYFQSRSFPKSQPLHSPSQFLKMLYKRWDEITFRRAGIQFSQVELDTEVFKQEELILPGAPWVPKSVPSLRILAAQAVSTYNRTFTGGHAGKYTVRSTDNLYPFKLPAVHQKWTKKVRDPNPQAKMLTRSLPRAINLMYDALGTRPFFNSRRFDWSKRPYETTPQNTSAGIRAGGTKTTVVDGITIKRIVGGTKRDQEPYAVKDFEEFLRTNGTDGLRNPAWLFAPKTEIYNRFADPDPASFDEKCRLFKVSFSTGYYLESFLCKDRMMMERGDLIRIGMTWWHGGAAEIHRILTCGGEDYVYCDGDFKNFDMSVNRVWLELYMSFSGVYYKLPGMERESYNNLLKEATAFITRRMTHVIGPYWKCFIGGMPSGALDTSHGDSWIVLALYCTYLVEVALANPKYFELISQYLRTKILWIIIYGDDHTLKIPRKLYPIVSETKFHAWLRKFWDMELKEIREDIPLWSVPSSDGYFKVKGVIFLQRGLIRRPSHFTIEAGAPVAYPYRSGEKYPWKIAYGSDGAERDEIDILLSCIGNAYDTMGTNLASYEFIKFIFCGLFNHLNLQPGDIRARFKERMNSMRSASDLSKLQRKCGIETEDLIRGFPTLLELERRHAVLPIHNLQRVPADASTA